MAGVFNTTAQPATPSSLFLEDAKTITVIVGEEQLPFTVRQAVLTRQTPFFASACKREWNNSSGPRAIQFPEHEPHVFFAFLNYQNSGAISLPKQDRGQTNQAFVLTQYEPLLELYVLANYVNNLALCNAVVDKWLETWTRSTFAPSEAIFIRAFEILPPSCKLLDLCRDQACFVKEEVHKEFFASPNWPKEMTEDLFLYIVRSHKAGKRPKFYDESRLRCEHHEHNAEFPLCAAMYGNR